MYAPHSWHMCRGISSFHAFGTFADFQRNFPKIGFSKQVNGSGSAFPTSFRISEGNSDVFSHLFVVFSFALHPLGGGVALGGGETLGMWFGIPQKRGEAGDHHPKNAPVRHPSSCKTAPDCLQPLSDNGKPFKIGNALRVRKTQLAKKINSLAAPGLRETRYCRNCVLRAEGAISQGRGRSGKSCWSPQMSQYGFGPRGGMSVRGRGCRRGVQEKGAEVRKGA